MLIIVRKEEKVSFLLKKTQHVQQHKAVCVRVCVCVNVLRSVPSLSDEE